MGIEDNRGYYTFVSETMYKGLKTSFSLKNWLFGKYLYTFCDVYMIGCWEKLQTFYDSILVHVLLL